MKLTIIATMYEEGQMRGETHVNLDEQLELGAQSFSEASEILHEIHRTIEAIRDKQAGLKRENI